MSEGTPLLPPTGSEEPPPPPPQQQPQNDAAAAAYAQAMMKQSYEAAMAAGNYQQYGYPGQQPYPGQQAYPGQQQNPGQQPYPGQNQSQNTGQQPEFSYPYAGAGGGGMPFFMPPPPGGQFNPYAPQQQMPPPPQARPPRASGRRNDDQTSQERRLPTGGSSGGGGGSGLPPLSDIFSNNNSNVDSTQPLLSGSAASGGGYGAMGGGSSSRIWSAGPPAGPPGSKKVRPVLVRTNSSGDVKSGVLRAAHRRSSSDTPLRGLLPPMAGTRSATANRMRTMSAGGPKGHRRGDSMTSINSAMSAVSVVSNIAKSSMFAGVTEKGQVQLHFPYECVRLVMIDGPVDGDLEQGKLYMESRNDDPATFERYHQITEDLENGQGVNKWELDADVGANNGTDMTDILPDPTYVLAVHDDVYRRIVSEIADSRGMPCGLFFCGHHEDVAHPSISIAVFAVVVLFTTLAYIAFWT